MEDPAIDKEAQSCDICKSDCRSRFWLAHCVIEAGEGSLRLGLQPLAMEGNHELQPFLAWSQAMTGQCWKIPKVIFVTIR